MIDEDEIIELVSLGSGTVKVVRVGLDMAMMRARGTYLAGRIEVEDFEAEVERLLLKRASLDGGRA